jgi:hypothetical protein
MPASFSDRNRLVGKIQRESGRAAKVAELIGGCVQPRRHSASQPSRPEGPRNGSTRR